MTEDFIDRENEWQDFDPDDIFAFGKNYFDCGYKPKQEGCYYNSSIAHAFVIIGKLYGDSYNGVSNYHKGVAYLENELNISKRQVKVLRKQLSGLGGYVFKTPYKIPAIISKMTDLLSQKVSDPIVQKYLWNKKGSTYRDILIKKQMTAIRASAKHDEGINEVLGQLENLYKVV